MKITPSSGNVFTDLGFEDAEARRLLEQTDAEIASARLKRELSAHLQALIASRGLRQDQAAQLLGISRLRVSDLVANKLHRFSVGALVDMLTKAGKNVTVTVC